LTEFSRMTVDYNSPSFAETEKNIFDENRNRISISGVQEKFSLVLEKNVLRLSNFGEQGTHILKPIPTLGKKSSQIPANEHLTMQIASQIFKISTAENAIIFFRNGEHAYITKRFDLLDDGSKLAQDDFASLAEMTPQTDGEHYKYPGNYLDLLLLLKKYVPTYTLEAPKLLKIILFNFLFSNGDAHYKNFSILETPLGDYRLSPAYDLLNSRIHIDDKDFALEEGILPKKHSQGKIKAQFTRLADLAGISKKAFDNIFDLMISKSNLIEKYVNASFLDDSTKRNYLQAYNSRLKQIMKT
jgi:serine/threonine-protein kinase HipA